MKIQDKHLDRKTNGHTGKRVESILQHSCLSSASASQKIKEAKWNVEKVKVKGMYVKCEQKKITTTNGRTILDNETDGWKERQTGR